jgi:L-ascorbate metabolism protein UlaG (beta-lactamase superfamily)
MPNDHAGRYIYREKMMLLPGLRVLLPLALLTACATSPEPRDVSDKPYHHTPTGFRNAEGSPRRATTHGFSDRMKFLWKRIIMQRETPEIPADHVLPRQQALADLAAHTANPTITWLGHAAFLIRMGGKNVLTDPYLKKYASPLGPLGPARYAGPGLKVAELPPIDVVIVSHNHYDHLDEATIEALPNKDRITVLAPLRLGDFFRERGYKNVRDVDWHDKVTFGELSVTALPAVHWSRRGLNDINQTLWMGAMLEADGRRLYFSGDTGYGPVFGELGRRYGPFDLALVPIGAYLPVWLMKTSHTNPEEAVQLGRDLKARTLLAHHWGTVVLSDEPPFEPPQRFRAAARAAGFDDDNAWIMKIGETRDLPAAK